MLREFLEKKGLPTEDPSHLPEKLQQSQFGHGTEGAATGRKVEL